jgi:hypothetical protein
MAASFRRLAFVFLLLGLVAGAGFAEDSAVSKALDFGLNLGIGVQSFPDELDELGNPVTYQSLALTPEFSFGQFGIGLAVTLDYRFTGTDNQFEIRKLDWWPADPTFQSVLTLYLAKIMYISWGTTTDPLFIKFGSFDDGTLGHGFILGNYDNTLFLPGDRHFGLEASLDGSLFKFPYVGMQLFVGSLGAFDVLGGRVYARPLVSTSIPILKNLEVGFTTVVDTNPYLNTASEALVEAGSLDPATTVTAFGGDVSVPLVYVENVVSLLAYTDVASLQGQWWGGMLGVGGKFFNFLTYGVQLRLLGENFIPDYFGSTYDLMRDTQYAIVTSETAVSEATVGWSASLGTSFLDDKFVFNVTLEGPFTAPPAGVLTEEQKLLYLPHLSGILYVAEGVIPSFSFDFSYDKKAIDSFASLISAENAAIQARMNFSSGPAVISFVYKIVYDPTSTPDPWNVTSGLESSISLF